MRLFPANLRLHSHQLIQAYCSLQTLVLGKIRAEFMKLFLAIGIRDMLDVHDKKVISQNGIGSSILSFSHLNSSDRCNL